ncbi:MAG: hypothetical protein WA678_02730 [Rhabdochlamydiaceae bacterium]
MDNPPEEHLPIGRAALAKVFCADWISDHSKTILLSFITLILFSFCLFQFTGKFSSGKKSDYLEIQNAFNAWVSQKNHDHNLLKKLEKPLSRHPELQAKFGTQIAQRLLSLGDVGRADVYAKAAFVRSQDLTSPYYSRFSRNSLIISQGKYLEALEEAKNLKTDLEKDDAFWERRDKFAASGTVLFAYNLVRIASLERQLGSKEGELKAWEELVQNAGWKDEPVNLKTYDHEAYHLLAQNFTTGNISLLDFIEQRKKELN